MSKKNKSFLVWGILSMLSLILVVTRGTGAYTDGGLGITWIFFSWNFLAYGFDRGMWPRVFVELDGQGKGNAAYREVYFWGAAVLYLLILSVITFAR